MTLVTQAVQTLRLDAIAADLVTALRERGIEPVLPKGPALARRLYRPEPCLSQETSSGVPNRPSGISRAAREAMNASRSSSGARF
jgi:hypothetical protein